LVSPLQAPSCKGSRGARCADRELSRTSSTGGCALSAGDGDSACGLPGCSGAQ
ncbi:unnamed protein product, partial [Symbiodinium pilosum]